MARISKLANPEFAQTVAEAYINGVSRTEMAQIFGAHTDTITAWTRDPRVQAHAARFAQERVNRITRKTDAEMERRLENAEDMDTDTLLKVRKEYLERALKIDLGKGAEAPETINEMMANIESNPDMARVLKDWAAGPKG